MSINNWSVIAGFLSAMFWFASALAPSAPVGHWGDSPAVVRYDKLSPIFSWLNRGAAVLTGIAVLLQAIAH